MTNTTPGPWRWFGHAKFGIYLATTHSGRRIVMDFVRKGMSGAQPRFQPKRDEGMITSDALLKFEVGDRHITGISNVNDSVYRLDINGIDAPDARLIEASSVLLRLLKEAVGMEEKKQPIEDWLNEAREVILKIEGDV